MKLAFVHLMRTGGSYAVGQLHACGLTPICAWSQGLSRDWTRGELLELLQTEQAGVIHNHSVGWDREAIAFAREHGWSIFAIARDPVDQLASLYHFWYGPGKAEPVGVDEFIRRQLDRSHADCRTRVWEIPAWHGLVDRWIAYRPRLYGALQQAFGLEGPEIGPIDGASRLETPSAEAAAAMRKSEFYARYLEVLSRCE